MRRLGTPEDIGNSVALLCMEEAGFITGQVIHVDGGRQSWTRFSRLRFREGRRQEAGAGAGGRKQEMMHAVSAQIRRAQDRLFDDFCA